jgi:hypothetical protein
MVDVSLRGTKEVDYDKLWYIHGQAYDLTDWLDKHPGEYFASFDIYGPNTFNLVTTFRRHRDRIIAALCWLCASSLNSISPAVLSLRCRWVVLAA